jgi:hypothetical protein
MAMIDILFFKLKTMTQKERIKKHLEKGKSLTAIQALNLFNCFRLAARISDLRSEGMNILTENCTLKNGKNIAKYTLN